MNNTYLVRRFKRITYIQALWIISIFSILPFIVLSIFIHPNADDFAFYNMTEEHGYYGAQIKWYREWTGRYFSTAILSLKVFLSNKLFFYRIFPIFLIASLVLGIYKSLCLIFENCKKNIFLQFSFIITATYFYLMPSIFEGLYWLSGSVTYQLANIFFIWIIYFFIRAIRSNGYKYFIISLCLIIAFSGLNETSLILLLYYQFCIIIYLIAFQIKFSAKFIAPFIITIICFITVYLAPGNAVRASMMNTDKDLIFAIVKSTIALKAYLGIWVPTILLIGITLVELISRHQFNKTNRIGKINTKFIMLVILLAPWIGFFISYWSMGWTPPKRTLNLILFHFIIGVFFCLFHLAVKYRFRNQEFLTFSKPLKIILLIVIAVQLQKSNNIREAYTDLLLGKATKYNIEMNERAKRIVINDAETIIVSKIISRPKTIFGHDIDVESSHWRNIILSDYYNKEAIKIEE